MSMVKVLLASAIVLGVITIADRIWHPSVTPLGQDFDDGYNPPEATHGTRTDLVVTGY